MWLKTLGTTKSNNSDLIGIIIPAILDKWGGT